MVPAVPQFVRQRHHVARFAEIVQHQIGMRARYRRMGEGARRLALAYRRIDPAGTEERLGDLDQLRRKPAIGGEDGRFRRLPVEGPVVARRQRRVAVPNVQFAVELVLAEPFRLHRVIAMR
jgi:hypothetical protein